MRIIGSHPSGGASGSVAGGFAVMERRKNQLGTADARRNGAWVGNRVGKGAVLLTGRVQTRRWREPWNRRRWSGNGAFHYRDAWTANSGYLARSGMRSISVRFHRRERIQPTWE